MDVDYFSHLLRRERLSLAAVAGRVDRGGGSLAVGDGVGCDDVGLPAGGNGDS